MLADIRDRADIARLVDAFYARAFADPLIGPIFTEVAQLDLEQHLPVFTDFWETVLFRAGSYRRNALQVHLALSTRTPMSDEHFARWLEIWASNVDELFSGEVAERAKLQATRIGGSMHRRVQGCSASEFATVRHRADAEGGDPACWLDRVCTECGAFLEGSASGEDLQCWRCGTEQPLSDNAPKPR